jgi:CheY-like chemotaxis protein
MNQNSSLILVIEDESEIATIMSLFLRQSGFWPVTASDGAAGLQLARELDPSLILCDAALPGMEGPEIIAGLRASEETAHIPVILMSGYNPARFDGCEADAFLQKPFYMSDMVKAVRQLMASTKCRDAGSAEAIAA